MTEPASLIRSISHYVDWAGNTRSGLHTWSRWASSQEALRPFGSLGEAVRAGRGAGRTDQDILLGALLVAAPNEPLGHLAVVAVLATKLNNVLASWRRGGASSSDLAALQGDLVAACWEAVVAVASLATAGAPLPPGTGQAIVNRARQAVRTGRRRELRAWSRQVALEGVADLPWDGRVAVAEALGRQIRDAVRAGALSTRAAAPVFLTRVAGYSTKEAAQALGYSPETLRALRSRTERQLVA